MQLSFHYRRRRGDKTEGLSMAQRCEEACSDYRFPHRLEDIVILEHVRRILPEGSAKAPII